MGPPRKLLAHSGVLNESAELTCEGPLLAHWTRANCRPWPGQSMHQFRRDLLWDHTGADHGAMATLLRILSMRKLSVSTDTIRGGYPVVCFTAVPLDEFLARRVYRRHRGRWDFVPYGLAISQAWLIAQGARPVTYADAATWNALSPDERPFFQLFQNGSDDWRAEQEWRVVGDVDLSQLPANQACVFVPSALDARWVSFLSRWPVRVITATAPALSQHLESAPR